MSEAKKLSWLDETPGDFFGLPPEGGMVVPKEFAETIELLRAGVTIRGPEIDLRSLFTQADTPIVVEKKE